MTGDEDKPRGLRVSWELNVGTILTALAMVTALTVWLVTGQNRSSKTQRNLDQCSSP